VSGLVCALVTLGCLCATPPTASAQGGVVIAGTIAPPETDLTPEQEERLLGEYWAIARRYRTADFAKAVAEMSAWTRDRIGKVQSIQYQPEGARPDYLEGRAEWSAAGLRGAAMLHTEIALAAFAKRDMFQFEFQTGIADGWLALADNRQSAPGSLRSRWNVAVARLLLVGGEVVLADRHLARINERIPNDPALQLAYGTVKETLAQRQLGQSGTGRYEDPTVSVPVRDAALNAAAALLTKAAGAGMAEARLRLAHVHILKRDDSQAEARLKEVLGGQPPPVLKYLASLMLGGIRERQRQLDAAARLYVEAVLAMPDGQSAYVALAHAMYSAGQRADAATVLDRLFGRRVTSATADPWWIYAAGLDAGIESRFDELRAEIRK
jgi:TolA-binding protein